jgi:glyoxylase-like metal-dependent hydrolase (beta-lactamase superfamily II)
MADVGRRQKEMRERMNITVLTVGPVQTNCYILAQEGGSSCVVVDPGEEAEKIAAYIKEKGLDCEAILLTHGHFDHITGVAELAATEHASVYAYEGERELMMDPAQNGCLMMGYEVALEPEILLRDGQKILLAGIEFEVIHTPGHTIGGCCYYVEKEKALFAGDTIFMESVGRTDFPTGNSRQLMQSVREKVLVLPDEVRIYPGHGPDTSVGYEKQNNPYA